MNYEQIAGTILTNNDMTLKKSGTQPGCFSIKDEAGRTIDVKPCPGAKIDRLANIQFKKDEKIVLLGATPAWCLLPSFSYVICIPQDENSVSMLD